MTERKTGLTYADAGVDIDAGNALVGAIGPLAAKTARTGLLGGIGTRRRRVPSSTTGEYGWGYHVVPMRIRPPRRRMRTPRPSMGDG